MSLRGLLAEPGVLGAWVLAADRSAVLFTNRTLWGLVRVNGRFEDVSGSGRIDAGGRVSGRLDIAAASVRTGIGKRDDHLRSPDFFDAEAHPQIVVEVSGAAPTGEHSADLTATLTVRGATLALPLAATVTRLGNATLHVVGRAEIDRTNWGVSGNMAGMMPRQTALVADTLFVKA